MQTFNAKELKVYPSGYHSFHGWYWAPDVIAAFVSAAFREKFGEQSLEYIKIHVGELIKLPAAGLTVGCHDTLYSVIVRVQNGWSSEYPTAEDVHDSYKETSAQFRVESIKGGYQFYTVW